MIYLKLINDATEAVANEHDILYLINEEEVVCKKAEVTPEGYVDLGLPSGLLWAKCNVGATTETEYGLLFQWGSTSGHDYDTDAKNYSTWSTAPFNNGSADYDSTYFASVSGTACPNGILASQYDAAYQSTNGVAHMPTKEDFNELNANTISIWTTINGVNGYKFISKTDASKNIFIPASGGAEDGSVHSRGSYGGVWSSSLGSNGFNSAWNLDCDSIFIGYGVNERYIGFSVRGVISK